MTSLQRQLFKYKRAESFKVPTLPAPKKSRPNKRVRNASKRRALSSASSSPMSVATFGSDTPSVFSSSPSIIGSPVYYNSPRISLEARIESIKYPTQTNNSIYEGTPDPYRYVDPFYSPSASPAVDLDS